MAKKKRRYLKRKKCARAVSSTRDVHHIYFPRREYEKRCWARALRNYWYSKILIPKDTLHRSIHSQISYVPMPSELVCKSMLEQLKMLEEHRVIHESDGIIKRLDLMIFMLEYIADDTANALKEQKTIAEQFYKGAG